MVVGHGCGRVPAGEGGHRPVGGVVQRAPEQGLRDDPLVVGAHTAERGLVRYPARRDQAGDGVFEVGWGVLGEYGDGLTAAGSAGVGARTAGVLAAVADSESWFGK
ncbi:hypothetical protein GCM10027615_64350 [Plantactinospora veratri]